MSRRTPRLYQYVCYLWEFRLQSEIWLQGNKTCWTNADSCQLLSIFFPEFFLLENSVVYPFYNSSNTNNILFTKHAGIAFKKHPNDLLYRIIKRVNPPRNRSNLRHNCLNIRHCLIIKTIASLTNRLRNIRWTSIIRKDSLETTQCLKQVHIRIYLTY